MKATLSLRSIADARFIALGNVELILSSIRAHDPMMAEEVAKHFASPSC